MPKETDGGEVDAFVKEAKKRKASDLHLTADAPPVFRMNGVLCFGDGAVLNAADTTRLFREIATRAQQEALQTEGAADFAAVFSGIRCRVSAFRQSGKVAMVFRLIPAGIPSLENLRFPNVLKELAARRNGLVIVSGAAGSGKSTTLAAMLDWINRSRGAHIITLEAPVEFLHCHGRSLVHQREIPTDAASFSDALCAALREDPDVLLIGEMRDKETIAAAVTAAETGHLVFATLHTADAPQAIDRMIDVFPPHQQPQVRMQLSMTLQAVIAQRLLPLQDGTGRTAALEILLATQAVRHMIREGKTHQLLSVLQTGTGAGMQTIEAALETLVLAERVSLEAASAQARDPEAFKRLCRGAAMGK